MRLSPAPVLVAAAACVALVCCNVIDRSEAPNTTCSEGKCECTGGFGDCDGDDANGCETPLATDPLHCGSCGRDCQGGDCVLGQCEPVVLAEDLDLPIHLALAPPYVYVTALDRVLALPLDGGPPEVVADDQDGAVCITATDTLVIWQTNDGVWSSPRGGMSEPTLIVPTSAPPRQYMVRCIIASSEHVYWFTEVDELVGLLQRVPLAGGLVETIGSYYYSHGIATDGTDVYWTNLDGIWHLPTAGAPEAALFLSHQSLLVPFGLAIDSESVYFTDYGARSVWKAGRADGVATQLLGDLATPQSIAVDGSVVYWTDTGTGIVARVPADGGDSVTIATGQDTPRSVAIDETSLYWLSTYSGKVIKLAK